MIFFKLYCKIRGIKLKGIKIMLKEKIEKYLLSVQKPARYIGGEAGSVIKQKDKISVRFAFCFSSQGFSV